MPHLLFITGKLAEPALRRTLAELAPRAGFESTVAVLPITVAALATTSWIARHLHMPPGIDRVILPGLCQGDLAELADRTGTPVERGPIDLLDLAEFFGRPPAADDYGRQDIAILAEINHAPRMSITELLAQASALAADGADIIDVGCDPGAPWAGVGDAVRALKQEGHRVSIDSFQPEEIEAAVAAGAELVLSVQRSNVKQARSWGCEVVAVPDVPATLEGLDETIAILRDEEVPFRIDPILEPIGFGLAASLGRYLEIRRCYPDAEMLMGVGNLTELTDCDSAGINVLLLGFCQEVGIRSVLTTQVVNWCRTCVRELDLARRLVYHACTRRVLPKHREPNLVMLRDPKLRVHGQEMLGELASRLTDPHFRLFAEQGLLHVISKGMYLKGTDPFVLFEEMAAAGKIDASHAFYLGYELAKAATALALGKNYVQDQALNWGMLTRPEAHTPPLSKGGQ